MKQRKTREIVAMILIAVLLTGCGQAADAEGQEDWLSKRLGKRRSRN